VSFGDGTAFRPGEPSLPVIFAINFRAEGSTGVHTHIHQFRHYLGEHGTTTSIISPFSWGALLSYPVFAPRLLLERVSGSANVAWYRHWHELFLRNALRRHLAGVGDCVIYAQGPLEARASLRARQGPHQRVVMAVHFRTSQADEFAEPGREIRRDGMVFRVIRRTERAVIPRLDGIVYVSEWARSALLGWLPEAARVPAAVIPNFVARYQPRRDHGPQGDLVTTGRLEARKNHQFLLEVLAEARRGGRIITLDVFGDGPLRSELEQLSRSLQLPGQVRFRGTRFDLREFLPGYRAYVHASRSETSSLAIMEALAAGLPIVAADIGPISELVDEGVEACFWPLDDQVAAAAILTGLLDSEPARQKAASAASDRFRRDFDASVVAPRLLAFLLEVGTAAAAPRRPPAQR
jgi:glycosyltransferase involved in cell wall biosynthesis